MSYYHRDAWVRNGCYAVNMRGLSTSTLNAHLLSISWQPD